MSVLGQLKLLMWKNFLEKRRQVKTFLMDLILPVLFSFLLLCQRAMVHSEYVANITTYESFSVEQLPPSLHSTNLQLAYVPGNVTAVQQVALQVQISLGLDRSSGRPFNTKEKLEEFLMSDADSGNLLAAVVFNHTFTQTYEPLPRQVKYYLRVKSWNNGWDTDTLFPPIPFLGPRAKDETEGGFPGYYEGGFLAVQHAVDLAIMQAYNSTALGALLNHTQIFLSRFPFPSYTNDYLAPIIQAELAVILILSFSYATINVTRALVQEKERSLKEYMRVMGLNKWLHWSAWFFTFFIIFSLVTLLITLTLCVKLTSEGKILAHSDPSLVFIFLLTFAVSTIAFGFMMSTFFCNDKRAAMMCSIIYLMSYLPYVWMSKRFTLFSQTWRTFACLFPNVALGIGTHILLMFEEKGIGIQWSNLFDKGRMENDICLAQVLGMLLLDAKICFLITWFVEALYPGKYGVPLQWNFFLQRSYWCVRPCDQETLLGAMQGQFFESEPEGMSPGIQMENLGKVFRKGRTANQAVKDLTLNMFQNQITVLLGHNGAGKTTTLSMLTGLLPPSSGKAYINGYDIGKDMTRIRHNLGLCPQQSVLFHHLTVNEHLLFYAQLRGCPQKRLKEEVDHLVKAVGLEEKRNAFSQKLSGGMKRKLSIAVAFTGDSKVVMLDEPTSGMDPEARRATWDLLQEKKLGRTILLTTHQMDEADLLGDRIAIMANGELQCCGSPLFLKTKYGVGYHLVMVKAANCNVSEVKQLIHSHVPEAVLENNVGAELSFVLPKDSTNRFEGLFTDMETKREDLGIDSYGASITTMEEVFLRVGKLADSPDMQAIQLVSDGDDVRNGTTVDSSINHNTPNNIKFNTGVCLFGQQFYALLLKRALYSYRTWKVVVLQFLSPLLYVIIGLWGVSAIKPHKEPQLSLSLRIYGNTTVPVEGPGPLANTYISQLASQLAHPQIVTDLPKYVLQHSQQDTGSHQHCVVGVAFRSDWAIAYFNNQGFHTPATTLLLLDNAIYKLLAGPDASIEAVNFPLPISVFEDENQQFNNLAFGIVMGFVLIMGISSLASTFSMLLVTERTINVKHVQRVSGANLACFWLSAFLWDMLTVLLVCLLFVLAFWVSGPKMLLQDSHLWHVLVLLLFHGWAVIPFIYLLSFLFKSPGVAYNRLHTITSMSGFFAFAVVLIISLPGLNHEDTADLLDKIFLLLPTYCMGRSFYDLIINVESRVHCLSNPLNQDFCQINSIYQENVFSMTKPGVGRFLVAQSVQGVVCLALLFIIEFQSIQTLRCITDFLCRRRRAKAAEEKGKSCKQEDSDVAQERERVSESTLDKPLILKDVTKVYGIQTPMVAVDKLSLAVEKGECFGLLGFNGAGKTSTFKMLTGEEAVTGGEAFIDGCSVLSKLEKVRQRIGYCPQTDALLGELTGRETLTMYARLRGVPESQLSAFVQNWLSSLLFDKDADKLVSTYSGGTKRKLCAAVALIGNPPLLMLDEPSTGMDPVARRLLWDSICRMRDSGKAIILSTHSMEECEALCTRLAVMAKGRFQCLGSIQHLKSKFGSGYTLLAKVPQDRGQDDLQSFKNFIESSFPGSKLKDEHQGMVHYHLTGKELTWAQVFGTLEAARQTHGVEDYSVSQISLEQVFLNFGRFQHCIKPDETEE